MWQTTSWCKTAVQGTNGTDIWVDVRVGMAKPDCSVPKKLARMEQDGLCTQATYKGSHALMLVRVSPRGSSASCPMHHEDRPGRLEGCIRHGWQIVVTFFFPVPFPPSPFGFRRFHLTDAQSWIFVAPRPQKLAKMKF